MKVCVITPLYALAGVPLAQMRLARALAERGHDVDLVFGYIAPHFPVPEVQDVNVKVWNRPHVRQMLGPLWNYLRSTRPAVVFSAEDHLTAVVLVAAIASGTKAKISGSSRVLPSDSVAYSDRLLSKGWVLKHVMKAVMWRADALTCVSRDMVGHYREVFRFSKHVCVYNIIGDAQTVSAMQEAVEHEWLLNKTCPVVIAAGTLTTRKGFADLVRAISMVRLRRHVRLMILGEGPLRRDLEELVKGLGMSDVVSLPGNVENPLKYFRHADVFVLSSYAEGMPNVLVEAMVCGCTPVATDCPTGPRELLADGRYGYLVPMRNQLAMASAIEQALDHPIPRTILDDGVRCFKEDVVISRHLELLGFGSPGK